MSGQLLKDGMIDLRTYEIIHEPTPANETPRQFILRMTGRDISALTFQGRDYTWQEIEYAGAMPLINRLIQGASLPPRILLQKKHGA